MSKECCCHHLMQFLCWLHLQGNSLSKLGIYISKFGGFSRICINFGTFVGLSVQLVVRLVFVERSCWKTSIRSAIAANGWSVYSGRGSPRCQNTTGEIHIACVDRGVCHFFFLIQPAGWTKKKLYVYTVLKILWNPSQLINVERNGIRERPCIKQTLSLSLKFYKTYCTDNEIVVCTP